MSKTAISTEVHETLLVPEELKGASATKEFWSKLFLCGLVSLLDRRQHIDNHADMLMMVAVALKDQKIRILKCDTQTHNDGYGDSYYLKCSSSRIWDFLAEISQNNKIVFTWECSQYEEGHFLWDDDDRFSIAVFPPDSRDSKIFTICLNNDVYNIDNDKTVRPTQPTLPSIPKQLTE